MIEPSSSLSRVAELLLARLLPVGKTAPSAKKLQDDLKRLGVELNADEWANLINELKTAGLLVDRPLKLSDAGRTRAMKFLGLDQMPPRATWQSLVNNQLFPLAAGIPLDAKEMRQRLRDSKSLTAYLLKRHFNLRTGPSASLGKTLEAVACRELGFPDLADLAAVKMAVLSRMLKSEQVLKMDVLERQLPRIVLNAPGGKADELRGGVVRKWMAEGASKPASSSFDLSTIAAIALRAAGKSPGGWFGDNKVFINHVYRQFLREQDAPEIALPEFKKHIVAANTAGLMRLSRADLVEAMDPNDVRESAVHYLNAEFHFVLVERKQS